MNTQTFLEPKSISSPELIIKALNKWRAASTRQLVSLIQPSSPQETTRLKRSFNRLRRRRLISTVKYQREFLNFHYEEERRYKNLLRTAPELKAEYVSKSGLKHHLEIVDLFLLLQRESPNLKMFDNPLTALNHFSTIKKEGRTIRCAPDLSIICPWLTDTKLLYVEFERSQKAYARYNDKWMAYEFDDLVDRVFYVIENECLQKRISENLRKYFYKAYMANDFFIAYVLYDDLKKHGLSAECVLHTGGKEARASVRDVLNHPSPIQADKSTFIVKSNF